MNSQVAEDFRAALLAMQELETDRPGEDEAQQRIDALAEEMFAVLDAYTTFYDDICEPFERIAA